MLNIVKLCVGISAVEELEALHEVRLRQHELGAVNVHTTRMKPRRAGEIVGQGSLYWVMSGAIRCRQPILALEPDEDREGKPRCRIVLDPGLVRTRTQPKRPFQGWRYLKPEDAPEDLPRHRMEAEGDESLAEELAEFGLI